jgi:hypothetical protein
MSTYKNEFIQASAERSSDADSVVSSESVIDERPPFRCVIRPAQFPQGKTATSLEEMDTMIKWYLAQGKALELTHMLNTNGKRYKEIVHLIVVNNNLIESEQWNNRIIQRKGTKTDSVINSIIFSSKSEVSTSDKLYNLVSEGEYDPSTDTYIRFNYVLMCTNKTRLHNLVGSGPGPGDDSILKRMQRFHPDVGFVLWLDEIDKFISLHSHYIPLLQSYENVLCMTGITATPYKRFWKLMHDCGISEVDLVGIFPTGVDYRYYKHHNLIYTDDIDGKFKSPAKNFQYILENPGQVTHTPTMKSLKLQTHKLPDLTKNTSSILFVPGEVNCKSHYAISKLAHAYNKHSLVINGQTKAFYKCTGERLDIREYKELKIAEGHTKYENMSIMDVAVEMYNDKALELRYADLVITGFNCVERGVTFNRPNFQFKYMILSPYHYKEGSGEVESIIQVSGRAFGNPDWVPEGINVLAPKYITDEVNKQVENLISYLEEQPDKLQYADIYRETNGVPIMIRIVKQELLAQLLELGNLTKRSRPRYIQLLQEGVESGDVEIVDRNRPEKNRLAFNFETYTLKQKRILQDAEKAANYRFPQFYEHHRLGMVYGQSLTNLGEYTLDLTNIPIECDNGVTLPPGTGFISFAYLPNR